MDDDLRRFNDTTDRSLGSNSDSSQLNPTTRVDHPDASQQSLFAQIRKAASVLIFGRFNDTRYALRDRLAILLKIGSTGVLLGSLVAVAFDYFGIRSGPLWEFQVLIRDVMMRGFTLAGETGLQMVNNPLLTLLVVLASVTLIRIIN